jgi:hypothetical protein
VHRLALQRPEIREAPHAMQRVAQGLVRGVQAFLGYRVVTYSSTSDWNADASSS